MNQIFPSVCAVALLAGGVCANGEPCNRAMKATCYVVFEEPCAPPPLKKTSGCYDAYREPYRISYPKVCHQTGEFVEITNTQRALAMRQRSIIRQRQMLAFEQGILAAETPLTQVSPVGAILPGSNGAGVLEEPNAPLPVAPCLSAPIVVPSQPCVTPRVTRVLPAPIGEKTTVTQYLVVAKPVPGKVGFVFCPFRNTGYVDVTGMAPGTIARDPYTGRPFRVP